MRIIAVVFALSGCATASLAPEESAIRGLLWEAATECARTSSTITITDVDHYGRVHYSLAQGGKQDVPEWETCYHRRAREAFAKSPELARYYQEKIAPR
jgi:hypothetical protein